MDGKFNPEQELLSGGKEVVVSGPITWGDEDEVTAASLHVAILQGKVAATGRTANDLLKGEEEFFVTAKVEGNGHLRAGDAIATGWAFLHGEGVGMYEWSVPVTLKH